MLGGLRRGPRGLSNSRPSTLTTLSLPITQSPADRLQRLGLGQRARARFAPDPTGAALSAASSTVGLDRLIGDAGGIEHLPADRAGRGEDQGQQNNLVEKQLRRA